MATPVAIIEVLSDGKYQLNEEELKTIVLAAEECERVAIISIIGSEGPEERFVLNCLANYLNAQNKEKWPDFTQNVNICGSIDDKENNPLVWMWSKPFILKDDDQNTAVFLMDANHVLNFQTKDSNICFTEEIIDLFCGTSSTIIYLFRGQFDVYELTAFKKLVEKVFNRSLNNNSYEELIYLVINWETKDKNYLFGAKGGQQYLKEFSVNLDHLFNETKCYLLPSIGADLSAKELVFSEISERFIEEFLKLIRSKLLNIDEMNVKKGKNSENIEPKGLIAIFRESVQRLNDHKFGETNGEESDESFEVRKKLRQSLSNSSSESESIEVIETEDQRLFEFYSEDRQEINRQLTDEMSHIDNDMVNNLKEKESNVFESVFPYKSLKLSQSEVTDNNVINSDRSSTSKDSVQPFEEKVLENQEYYEINQISDELMEHKIERTADIDKSISKEHKIDGQSDEDRTDSNNTEEGEEPFTDLTYETVSDSTEPFVLIEKYKKIHLNQLKSYIETCKFITRQELLENHLIFVNENKQHFNNEVKNRSEDRIKELNQFFNIKLNSNYREIGLEIDRRRERLKEEKSSELILMFCMKLNDMNRSEELIAKDIWEERVQEIEQIVYQSLNQEIGQKDPLLEQEISAQLTKELEKLKIEFMSNIKNRFNNFNHKN